MRIVCAFLLFSAFSVAHADSCESVIALSKISSNVVEDKSVVEKNAENFCSEYSKRNSNSRNDSYGVSYKFLSANMGSDNTSEEAVASKYCSASESNVKKNDSYKQYIESISPGAYPAYQQCLELQNRDMRFNVNTASVLPKEFSMYVGFTSSINNQSSATVAYSSSSDVTCQWNGNANKTAAIPTGSTIALECKRSDQTVKSYVSIARTDAGRDIPLTLPWQTYDHLGNPVDALATLQRKVTRLESEAAIAEKNSVVAFLAQTCPSGWRAIQDAQGRFLRGIDNTGANDPDGKRSPGSLQADTVGKHTHTYQSGFHEGQSNSGTGADSNKKNAMPVKTSEGDGLGSETRPKNIAVLFCTK